MRTEQRMLILILVLIAAALIAAWLFLTWYHADDEPVFAPASHRRVLFKTVLEGALRDVRDVLQLDVAAKWLVTNTLALAVFASGLLSMAEPTLRQAILNTTWDGVPIGALAMLAVTWLASVKRAA